MNEGSEPMGIRDLSPMSSSRQVQPKIIAPGPVRRSVWDDLFSYRELLYVLVWRQLATRYRQMAFGVVWVVIEPLLQMGVVTIFFGLLFRIPSDGIPFPVFAFSGLLPWVLMSRVVNDTTTSLRDNMPLLSKVFFPRILLPTAAIARPFLDATITFIVLVVMAAAFGYFPQARLLVAPVFFALAVLLAYALGLTLSVIVVRYRDITLAISLGLQLWLYLTPVLYSPTLVPGPLQVIYQMNPMYLVVEGIRWSVLGKEFNIMMQSAIASCCIVFVLLWIGIITFYKFEQNTVDFD